MDKILKDLKDRYITVVIFIFLMIIVVAFLIDRAFFAPKRKKAELPCYNQKLVIWSPFTSKDFSPITKKLNKYCLSFEIKVKELDEIKENILLETAAGRGPDIVYIDNYFLNKNSKIFQGYQGKKLNIDNYPEVIVKFLNNKLEVYPLTFDTLVLFINSQYLANIGLYEAPQTFEEIEQIIPQLRQVNFNSLQLAPISLGKANNVDNFVEIFLTINKNLNQEKYKTKESIEKTLDYLIQFSNPHSRNYTWDDYLPNSLTSFAQERLIMLPAFYSQKQKIKELNQRLEFSVANFPKFQQSLKKYNYLKVYYLGVIKNKKSKYSWMFIEELDKNYKEFISKKNLIPLKKDLFDEVEKEQKIVINELLVGDYFLDVNYEYLAENLPKYFDGWLINRDNLRTTLHRRDIFNFFKR
ncbi:MAG: ABC transporter substrate-binding protein [Patescibacteria group bacterium]|nr:ABC transporter substrate-binding protein [Patescibacteria group bacterium]